MHIPGAIALLLPLIPSTLSTPVPALQIRDSPSILDLFADAFANFISLDKGIAEEIINLESALKDVQSRKINPISNLSTAFSSLSNITTTTTTTTTNNQPNIIELATNLLLTGLAPKNTLDLITGLTTQEINSINNTKNLNSNSTNPKQPIYPKKSPQDAPYSILDENTLRKAIYIPDTFEYGRNNKTPVLLVPGTAVPAGTTYYFNYEKLLRESDIADPVWVNIPGNSLGDIQVNAEYVAYAINYISGIITSTVSGDGDTDAQAKIGVLSWSQGGIDVQWALKYWPSTREIVDDFMALSADFHGTLLSALCHGLAEEVEVESPLCTPSIKQQYYNSTLIQTLRSDGGDSAYVATTSVYSGLDEIVQPQIDPNASAHLDDVRNVGVTNVQIQVGCAGFPNPLAVAGGVYLHETMLVNPLAYALFIDALGNEGPGNLSRVDLDTVCGQLVPPGLDLDDFLGTEVMALVYGVLDTLMYGGGGDGEPVIMDYA